MSAVIDLCRRGCVPLSGSDAPLREDEINALLGQLEHWRQYDRIIGRTFEFGNHYETLAFVNALAWVSHREDHHPELTVGYNKCHVEYTTHSINGLSMNDFICAAKVDALFRI
ncbi:MAG TPA: 4a-hydroxytetrahydrobiopterin dehydratase [Gallionellaceae bacterium]